MNQGDATSRTATASALPLVWGSGTKPAVSTLNVAAAETRANFATVAPGAGSGTSSRLSVSTSAGQTHVVIDVVGFFGASGGGQELVPASSPFRLADSRKGLGFAGAFGPGQTRTLTVSTANSVVPKTADAVVVNLTAVGPSAATHLKAYGAGLTPPPTSVLNAPAGAVVPNLAVVRLTDDAGGNGRFSVTNASGTVHVLVDVVGWFEPDALNGLHYFPQTPVRLRDSRTSIPLVPGGTAIIAAGLPAADVLLVNLAGVAPTHDTHLTIYPSVGPVPATSNLNLVAGQTSANGAVVRLQSDAFKIRNQAGHTHYLVDLSGWFAPPA